MVVAHDISNRVGRAAQSLSTRMRELRRYLHQRPELSGEEKATTEFLDRLVSDIGLKGVVANEERGLFVDLGHAENRGRIAVRGDIDALPITTQLSCDYASRSPGVMHACGHDAHTAMVWGAMAILKEIGGSPPAVRFIFQPAEETSQGGLHMIASGALEGVDAAIALHVDPSRSVGRVGVRDGAFTAGCDLFECDFVGKGGHGARPHLTSDTIDAACQWVADVHRRVPRATDARDAVVVNVGQFHAGAAPNVVPATAELRGTLRTLSQASAERSKEVMFRIADSIALTHECEVRLRFGQHTPPVNNNGEINHLLRTAASQLLGPKCVQEIEQPSMGAEDFSFIANQVPSAMFRLGVAGIDVGSEPLHTPKFDIDESALPIGASVLALAVLEWHG